MDEDNGNDDRFNDNSLLDFDGGPRLPDEHDWEEEDMVPLADLLDNARALFGEGQRPDDNSESDGVLLLDSVPDSFGHVPQTRDCPHSEQDQSEMNEQQVEELHPNWTRLPDVVLSHLFSKLEDNDIGAASRVCKCWHKTINDPTLWRIRHVKFGNCCLDGRYTKTLVGFARRHGQHIQKLRIQCPHPTYSVAKRFQSTMTSFLHILNIKKPDGKRCELRELTVNQLCIERYWRFENMRNRLVNGFTRFLKKQRRLVFCDFSENMLSAQEGLKVLESLGEASGRNMCVLNIEDFFATHLAIYGVPRFRLIMSPFHNLRSLITNYNYLSSEIIELLATNCEHKLKCLSIKAYRQDPYQHLIHPYSWKMLRRACPALRVCLYFEAISSYPDVLRIACREIPLKVVQIWTGIYNPEEYWRLDESIRYIAKCFSRTLEEACFYLENPQEDIDRALLSLLEKCNHLEVLDLQATIDVSTVDTICEWQQKYKIGLQRCHVAADNLSGVEIRNLDTVVDKYRAMLEFRGVDFQLLANPRF